MNTSKKSTRNYQLGQIHKLANALGMDREAYEEMLVNGYNVKSSRDLTPEQRYELIGRLTEAANSAGVYYNWVKPKVQFASVQAIRRLRYHSLWCAVRCAPLPEFVMEDGTRMKGERLREWLVERFDSVKEQPQRKAQAPIPKSILRYLSEEWINPLCNKWLEGADMRAWSKPSRCYFHELTTDEVQYLSKRWKQFQAVLEEESGAVDLPFPTEPLTNQEN